ncbi:DUF1877 family protein [Streptomyces sp. NBC_01465]|uniref:DUF1877 family protein n=1 Tax=Streptomyces sp. NBC_01465 TaxID=2903878 RepID=UPI002E32637F|nr:DUF1877 family protein [Streptomyces sp. NBC_01465]
MPENELRDDYAWLEQTMWDALDRFPEESALGISAVLEKSHDQMARIYRCARTGTELEDLPVFGGRPVFDPGESLPPILILGPEDVGRAAEFLAGTSFTALWPDAKSEVGWGGWDKDGSEAQAHFRSCHEDLTAFFTKTSASGHAVVKFFSF